MINWFQQRIILDKMLICQPAASIQTSVFVYPYIDHVFFRADSRIFLRFFVVQCLHIDTDYDVCLFSKKKQEMTAAPAKDVRDFASVADQEGFMFSVFNLTT